MANLIKDSELKALLAEVEQEIGGLLKSESLAKALPEGKPEDSPVPKEETPGEGHSGSPEGSTPPPPASEGAAATQSDEAGNPAEKPGTELPEGDKPMDSGSAGEGDLEALKGEYLKLGQEDPEALKAHYLACAEAIQSIMGGGGTPEQTTPPPAAPPAPPAAAPMGSSPPPAPAMKSEDASKLEALEKSVDSLVTAFEKVLSVPSRKAVTAISAIEKPGMTQEVQYSREQAMSILTEKAKSNLKKSDRERINQFAVKAIGLDAIKDLLA